ncbi:Hypothetical predicted protein, partial [Pelobates cultripes]
MLCRPARSFSRRTVSEHTGTIVPVCNLDIARPAEVHGYHIPQGYGRPPRTQVTEVWGIPARPPLADVNLSPGGRAT